MRALVVSNMLPDASHPERGSFVRDQVAALGAIAGLDVELFEFAPGMRSLARAGPGLRRHQPRSDAPASAPRGYDVVHAHFGLTAWPALAVRSHVRALTLHGTDLLHPRTRLISCAALPIMDLVACVSDALIAQLPSWARRRAQLLPCGVDVERFRPLAREQSRAQLGLDRDASYVLFPADPARPEKRHDRARALCSALGVELLALGGVQPSQVPLWINAANAVVVPSEREGFGLAVLEALACEVPVLATPVGIHPQALAHVSGSLCADFDLARWSAALEPHLHSPASSPSRDTGAGRSADVATAQRQPEQMRASALRFSAARMAEHVADAWHAALRRSG